MSKKFSIEETDTSSSGAEQVAQERMQSSAQRRPNRLAEMRQLAGDSPFARGTSTSRTGTEPSAQLAAPVDEFLDNPFNARSIYREERVAELAANIALEGQLSPVPVVELALVRKLMDEAGETKATAVLRKALEATQATKLLLGGHYRKRAITRLGDRPLLYNPMDVKSLVGLYLKSYAENDEREDTSPLDDALAWSNLLDLGLVKNHEQIAEATGKPRTTIVKTLALLKLPDVVQNVFREHPQNYSLTAGYLLTQLAAHVTADELFTLASKVVREELATRDLEVAYKKFEDGAPPRKPRDISRQHKILAREGSSAVGTIKEWDTGRLQLDVTITDPKEKDDLLTSLKDRFGLSADLGC